MSQVINELDQIAQRILIIGSSQLTLSNTLEALSTQALAQKSQVKPELEWAHHASGPIRLTASVNYAQRSHLTLRLHFLGTVTGDLISQGQRLLNYSNGILISLNPEDVSADELIRWNISENALQTQPIILTGLDAALNNPSHPGHLRALALLRWCQRRIPNLKYLESIEKFFEDSIEWVLSY